MNQAAIIHRPTSDYIYPSSRNTLELQLITARADADEIELWYWTVSYTHLTLPTICSV